MATLDSTHFIVAHGGGGGTGRTSAGSVSGSTITMGSEIIFNNASTIDTDISPISSSQAVVVYRDVANSNQGTAMVLNITGTTVASTTEYIFNNTIASYLSSVMLDSTHVAIGYKDSDNYAKAIVGTINGTAITFGTETTVNEAATNRTQLASLGSGRFTVSYDSTYGYTRVLEAAGGRFVGVAKTSGSAGASVDVITSGVADVFSGLTAGNVYYALADGSLTTTQNTYRVGLAISTTEVLLDGNQDNSAQFFGDMIFANDLRITEDWGPEKLGLVWKNTLGREMLTLNEDGDARFAGTITSRRLSVGTEGNLLNVDSLTGNIGVGTSTPAWKFNIATNGAPQLTLSDNTAGIDKKHGLISYIGGIFSIGTPLEIASSTGSVSNGAGANMSTSTTYFTISDTGRVGIGTTTPGQKFSVSGSVGFDGLTTGFGAGSLCLSMDGEVVYNAGSDSCLSSLRETKHDIEGLDLNALEKISGLNPVSFVYNEGDGRMRYGFVAEDAALVDEQLATRDANGNITGIDDRALLALTIKAIKELESRVQDLATSPTLTNSGQATTTTGILTDSSSIIDTLKFAGMTLLENVVQFVEIAAEKITAKLAIFQDVQVDALTVKDKLCVDDVCVSKDQLKELLLERGGSIRETNTATASSTPLESSNESLTGQAEPVLTEPTSEPTPVEPAPEPISEPAPEPVSEPIAESVL